ncbi:MAG: MoaD/ThiS family protein [Thermoproteota archaeon]|jgi:hypothetical protein
MSASSSNNQIKISLKGVLKGLAKTGELEISVSSPIYLENLLKKACAILGEEFEKRIFNENGEISSDILLEYEGKIIVARSNKNLLVKNGDKLVIFSFVHGG